MTTSSVPGRLRVLVASEQALVAEAVRAALIGRGHEAAVVAWPAGWTGEQRRIPRQRWDSPPTVLIDAAAGAGAEVGLLLSDLDRWSRIRAARQVIEETPVPWVVLTTAPEGPAWGAVLAAGCRMMLPGSTGLDRMGEILWSVAREGLTAPVGERVALEAAWREVTARREEISERLARLTPREWDVLRLMYTGYPVARIAERFGVSPATVRSQVKGVLRKLDVNSQIAAVAAFGDVLDAFERAAPAEPPSG